MTLLLSILVFVGLAFAGWLLNELFVYLRHRFRQSLQPPHRPPIDSSEISFTSRFAQSTSDIEKIVSLRASCFRKTIVPNSTYYDCWNRNPRSLKIVWADQQPIGYWGVAPISSENFEEFLAGKLSHHEILSSCVLSWEEVTEPVYLYIIGIVAPLPTRIDPSYKSLLGGALRGRVICDLVSFLNKLCENLDVSGVAGYPSTCEGLQVMSRFQGRGLLRTSVFIDGKETQPVFRSNDINQFRVSLEQQLSKYELFVPTWEAEDQTTFFNGVGCVNAHAR